tara:strand:+ start:925 stop:1245 length:321 start_codon:yes stop_codon:yes gene_type:complete
MINVTASAKEKLEETPLPNGSIGVRIRVEDSGCNGLSYALEWCYKKAEGDQIINQATKNLYIDPKSMVYLRGSDLTYTKIDKFKEGFEFINPNVTSKCGCGESFYV